MVDDFGENVRQQEPVVLRLEEHGQIIRVIVLVRGACRRKVDKVTLAISVVNKMSRLGHFFCLFYIWECDRIKAIKGKRVYHETICCMSGRFACVACFC